MPHIIGRGRYARETYPLAQRGGAGCILGVGMDSNEKSIDVLTSEAGAFLFPRQQDVQGNPVEVVLPDFALGDSLLIRYRIEWSYDPNSAVAPSSGSVSTAAVVDLGENGYEGIIQTPGAIPYSASSRIIQDPGLGGDPPLVAATAGELLFTPDSFAAPPRVAVVCSTDVPVDPSNPSLIVAEDSGPMFLEVIRIRGGCAFQEPAFTRAPLGPTADVPFKPA